MNYYYIISCTRAEAKAWITKNTDRMLRQHLHPVFLAGIDTLRGVSEPKGVFLGEWYTRPDALDIIQQLILSTNDLEKKQLFVDLVKTKFGQKDK